MEESIYKATFKELKDGLMTPMSLEVTIYGKDPEQIRQRFLDTARVMDLKPPISQFKMIRLERK